MNIRELERLQHIYKDAVNRRVTAMQKPGADPTLMLVLNQQEDAAKRQYDEAWALYQAQATK